MKNEADNSIFHPRLHPFDDRGIGEDGQKADLPTLEYLLEMVEHEAAGLGTPGCLWDKKRLRIAAATSPDFAVTGSSLSLTM